MGWGTSRKFTYREKVPRGRRLGGAPTSGGTLENTEKRQSPGGRPRAGSPPWPQKIWGFPASREGTPTFPLCQGAHWAAPGPAAREKLIGALTFLVGAGVVRTGPLTDVWARLVFCLPWFPEGLQPNAEGFIQLLGRRPASPGQNPTAGRGLQNADGPGGGRRGHCRSRNTYLLRAWYGPGTVPRARGTPVRRGKVLVPTGRPSQRGRWSHTGGREVSGKVNGKRVRGGGRGPTVASLRSGFEPRLEGAEGGSHSGEGMPR